MAAPGGGEGPAPGRGGRGLQGAMRAASGALGMDSAGRTRVSAGTAGEGPPGSAASPGLHPRGSPRTPGSTPIPGAASPASSCIPGILLHPRASPASLRSPASPGSVSGLAPTRRAAQPVSSRIPGLTRIPALTPHSIPALIPDSPRTPSSPRLPFGPRPWDPPEAMGVPGLPTPPGLPAQPPLWQEAYVEYLKSITLIAQALQEEAAGTESSEGVTPDTPKLLKLAEQCLERVKSIAAALGKAQVKPAVQERGGGPAPLPRHRRVCSDEGGKLSPFLPPEIFQKLQIAEAHSARKELTPLEEASLQNQKLKAAYEARVARLNPSQAVQKTSLTLSLQRQMMENLVIAKAREETLQRKMEERRLRLQEAANRRFSSSVALTPEEQEQRALYAAILEYEQDHDWPRQWKAQLKRSPADLSVVSGLFSCLLSCPEHPITQLLRRLQCAVYARLYPAVSRGPADASPASPSGLSFLSLDAGGSSLPAEPGGRRLRASRSLHCMFSVPEHGPAALRHSQSSTPLTDGSTPGPAEPPQTPRESSFEDLERFLASPEGWAPAEPPANPGQDMTLPELLKGIVRDIHNAIDRLLALTLLAFEGLGTAAGKDQCLACLEEAFFPPLWAPLLALYRTVQQPHEAALARSMERHRHASPADMGLASRLFPPAPGRPAYASAVQDLRLIPLETCPRRKLECIVRALRGICECAEEYCGTRDTRSPATAAIGADDLLPILSYVVLQTGLPQLLSECAALEEFIHEGYLIGEEGYCLTSLQSALSYVESLQ